MLYVIEGKKGPLMIRASTSEKNIENFVKKFPKRLKVDYRKINLEEMKKIEEKINEKLATRLIKKYWMVKL